MGMMIRVSHHSQDSFHSTGLQLWKLRAAMSSLNNKTSEFIQNRFIVKKMKMPKMEEKRRQIQDNNVIEMFPVINRFMIRTSYKSKPDQHPVPP